MGRMKDLTIPDYEPAPICHDCRWELTECACLTDPPEIK